MQALKVLALAALPAAAVATLVSVAISAFEVSILGNCDSKLGCWGGIQVGAVLAIVEYFLLSLAGHSETRERILSWVNIPLGGGKALDIGFGTRMVPLAVVMTLVVTVVGTAIHVYALGYMHGDPSKGRFFGKLSLFVFSILGIVVSPNFIQTFVFWELVGVSSYLPIGYYWTKHSAGEAAKKAFIKSI